jgi:pilus assembly protein Flp/PilA
MNFITSRIASFRRNSKGQDLLEYALLVALIAVIAVGAVSAAGGKVSDVFDRITSDLKLSAPAE